MSKNDAFIDDIVIHTREGHTKLLKYEQIQTLPDVPDELSPVVDTLLQRGVVTAAIPSNPGIGASCYLLNLASICRPESDDGET